MMHRAWSSIVEVPYCFSRSSVKFQGHTALKIVEFDPNWAFPDCNSSLNSPMAMKCCTKLETAKERCPIVFQGHPSNFKVTRYKTSPILTQIGRFWTIGQSQLSNPSDLPCSFKSWNIKVLDIYGKIHPVHVIFQGFVRHMEDMCPDLKRKGVIIGYDARYNSRHWAEIVATVLVNRGVKVYLFRQITPTPFVVGILVR